MTRKRRTAADLLGDDPPPVKRRPPPKPPTATRDRLNAAQAQLAEVRAAKMRGELVERADVLAIWAGIVADLRSGLLAAPSRIGAKLAMTPEAVAALDAEIRELLTALASAEALPRD
jgi:phage terminase Nu1 subunit (DNA packaging protein)